MPRQAPPSDELLARAAELRAGGATWDTVGSRVNRSADTVQRWPRLYPDRWKALFQAAEESLLAEATAESVHTLRRQLRSDDEKASREAAEKLMRYRATTHRRSRSRKSRAKPAQASAAAVRFAVYLEGLSDASLAELVDSIAANRPAQSLPPSEGRDPAASGDSSSPA